MKFKIYGLFNSLSDHKISFYLFIGSLIIHQFFTSFLQTILYPVHFIPQNLFFLELIQKEFYLSYEVLSVIDLINLTLIWLIGRQVLNIRLSFIPAAIYAISPWASYLTVAGSFYIYVLFLLLTFIYGSLLIKKNHQKWGFLLLVTSFVVGSYSSLFMLILLPVFFAILISLKFISFEKVNLVMIFSLVLVIPLFFLIYNNFVGFKNIWSNNVNIFSDPSILNTVNSYQGVVREKGFGLLGRISENKYIFYSEYVVLKYITNLIPTTFYTSEEKLLNFSFNAPIYLGFLIPFSFAFWQILKNQFLLKAFLFSTTLILPSILAKEGVDLNRLITFAPVVVFVISFGLISMYKSRNKKKVLFFFILSIILVIFQFYITLSDIKDMERQRYIEFYGKNFELDKQ